MLKNFYRLSLVIVFFSLVGSLCCAGNTELPDNCMQLMLQGQDALFSEEFDKAETLMRSGIQLLPSHPLPRVFLDSVLLAELQEKVQGKTLSDHFLQDIFAQADQGIRIAEAFQKQSPSAYSLLYLGGAYGARGLAHLYLKQYVSSYFDGRKAGALLRRAVALDPKLYNAYLGMGEFEYQSAHLGGVLQFILSMPGDRAKGLQMLKLCAEKGSYASMPAKIFLARIFTMDEKDYQEALPYVQEIYKRFPQNSRFARYAIAEACGLGLDKASGRSLMEEVCRHWDEGWRPHSYVPADVEQARLQLAKAYLQSDSSVKARQHLQILASSSREAISKEAKTLLHQ